MNKDALKYGLFVLLLPIIQELIFNHINLFGFINPLFYIIFIFIFPVYKDKMWLLIAAFTMGIFLDMTTNDGGIHTFALVFVSYIRLFILRFIKGTHFDEVDSIDIFNLGNSIQFTWIVLLVFIHHFLVFLLEQFSFHLFGQVLVKTILTSILTTLIIIFVLRLFVKKNTNVW